MAQLTSADTFLSYRREKYYVNSNFSLKDRFGTYEYSSIYLGVLFALQVTHLLLPAPCIIP